MSCVHVYSNVGVEVCPHCGGDTHEVDWNKQNKLQRQWLKDNPDAWRNVGWWSI